MSLSGDQIRYAIQNDFSTTAETLSQFRSIPTVGGPSAPLLSYISAYRFLYNAKEILAEGYQKVRLPLPLHEPRVTVSPQYNGSVFKVAQLDQWMVVVSGPEIIEDIRKRPDSEATFMDGAEEGFKTEHTIGRDWIDDPYHIDIFRAKLMRALPAILPDVLEELMLAIPRFIPVTEGTLRQSCLLSLFLIAR